MTLPNDGYWPIAPVRQRALSACAQPSFAVAESKHLKSAKQPRSSHDSGTLSQRPTSRRVDAAILVRSPVRVRTYTCETLASVQHERLVARLS